MDDYQRHLERQLQQQQMQLQQQGQRQQDLLAQRQQQQHQPQQQQPQLQRVQPSAPQWNVAGGISQQNQMVPGLQGFGRGVSMLTPQLQQQLLQQQMSQQQQPQVPRPTSFSPPPTQTPLQQNVHNSPVQAPKQRTQGSPSPSSPVLGDATPAEKARIATILEINSHLIKVCVSLQGTMPPAQNLTQDPTYMGCLKRLQENLSYLAAIADRATKPEGRPIPTLSLLVPPPQIKISEEKEVLDKLYKTLSYSLQTNGDATNGDNASGSESGSQVNSPQVRSRQTSAGSLGGGGPSQQHVPTPTMQRSQLPQHTPSPHLAPSQLHGQSNLNPNVSQANSRPPQNQQQFQQTFTQGSPFLPQQPQATQFQSSPFAQQQPPQQYQPSNPQFQQQNVQNLQQLNPSFQSQQQQFQSPTAQSFPTSQPGTSGGGISNLQPRVPSRPPSRPSSQHSSIHQPSPTMSPRPLPGPSPQLTSTPTPQPNPSPRTAIPTIPADLTPEQTAMVQERMRTIRMQRLQQLQQQQHAQQQAQQRANAAMNMFSNNTGVQQNAAGQVNGFPQINNQGFHVNGMGQQQNQNFGAGGGDGS